MSTKNTPKLPRKPLYAASVLLYGGFILVIAGLFVDIGVIWAFVGFAIVLIGAVVKVRFYRCPHCNAFRAVRKCNLRFESFNCPECKKKVDFEPPAKKN